jgi:hypothetical protein
MIGVLAAQIPFAVSLPESSTSPVWKTSTRIGLFQDPSYVDGLTSDLRKLIHLRAIRSLTPLGTAEYRPVSASDRSLRIFEQRTLENDDMHLSTRPGDQ